MGVIYKLTPEIIEAIKSEKKANPAFSCRGLAAIIKNKYQVEVSKSSINAIIKEVGLSQPVGRKSAKPKPAPVPEAPKEMLSGPSVGARLEELPKPEVPTAQPAEAKGPAIPLPSGEIIAPPAIEIPPTPPPSQSKPPAEEAKLPTVEEKKEVLPLVEKPVEPTPPPPLVEPPVEEEVEVKVEPKLEQPEELLTGAILLKAADSLIGGTQAILEVIKSKVGEGEGDLALKIETLLFTLGSEMSKQTLEPDFISVWTLKGVAKDISQSLLKLLPEVRCIKLDLSNQSSLYFDGQLLTIWSTPYVPYEFGTTICNIKSYINRYFAQDESFNFFMAPGNGSPSEEFFNFIAGIQVQGIAITKVTLCGTKLEELESIPVDPIKMRNFIFGLWPWQYADHRKVNSIGEFKPFHFETTGQDFYIADIEIELSQPNTGQRLTLKGAALKSSLAEKTRLMILSSVTPDKTSLAELVSTYLNRWPNLEEGLRDFNNKLELFTFAGDLQPFFSTENLNLALRPANDVKILFSQYLEALDLYVKLHFLPPGHEKKLFSTIKLQFYDLKASLTPKTGLAKVTFRPPEDYKFLKDLEYTCHRLNEKEITLPEGKRLLFSV